ncbi:MAG: hypothetical protein R2834_00205 [Rhodothermales bacterium]
MTYLIATHSQLFALTFDENWRILDARPLATGHHYGIGFLRNDQYDAVLVKQDDRKVRVLDRQTLEEVADPIPFLGETGAIHQISCVNDGIYFTNTDFNNIVYQTLDGSTYHSYHFEGKSFDHNHINSVFPCGNQIYALLHNKGRTLTELAVLDHDPSAGFTFRHSISIWDHGCHNVFLEKNRLYYNGSSTGQFVVADLETQEVITRLSYPGHTKGISVVDNQIVIGFSEHAERGARDKTRGYLAVINQDTLKEIDIIDLDDIDLPLPVGNINEIRCISGGERSHAAEQPLSIDWTRIRLARRNPAEFFMKHVSLYAARSLKKLTGNKKL